MNDPTNSTPGATEQAKQVAAQAAGRAGDVATEAGEQAKAVAREARDHASDLLAKAKDDVSIQAQQRSGQAADGLRTLAGQIESLGRGDTAGAGPLLDYLRDAGSRVQHLAERFDQGPDAVLADVRSFARNRPLVFLGAAGALGFVAGRLVRSGGGGSSDGETNAEAAMRARQYSTGSLASGTQPDSRARTGMPLPAPEVDPTVVPT